MYDMTLLGVRGGAALSLAHMSVWCCRCCCCRCCCCCSRESLLRQPLPVHSRLRHCSAPPQASFLTLPHSAVCPVGASCELLRRHNTQDNNNTQHTIHNTQHAVRSNVRASRFSPCATGCGYRDDPGPGFAHATFRREQVFELGYGLINPVILVLVPGHRQLARI